MPTIPEGFSGYSKGGDFPWVRNDEKGAGILPGFPGARVVDFFERTAAD
jgi:hypothetical protein